LFGYGFICIAWFGVAGGVGGATCGASRSESAIRAGCTGLESPEVSCHTAGIERIIEAGCHGSACCAPGAGELSGWSEALLPVGHGVGRDGSGTEAACAEAEGRKTGAALGLPSSGFGSYGNGKSKGCTEALAGRLL